jgi:hypothetical protein
VFGALYSNPSHFRRNARSDYSLGGLPNRLEDEQLVVHRFPTVALGLAPLCPDLKQRLFLSQIPAVCVPPGTRLLLQHILTYLQQRLGVGAVVGVIFVQQSIENSAIEIRSALQAVGKFRCSIYCAASKSM